MRKAKPGLQLCEQVEAGGEDDRDRGRSGLGRQRSADAAGRDDDRHLMADQISDEQRQRWRQLIVALRPAKFDRDVLVLDKAALVQAFPESGQSCPVTSAVPG